jgi:hypothetical protein
MTLSSCTKVVSNEENLRSTSQAVNPIDEIGDRLNSAFQDPLAVAIGSRQLGDYSLLHLFRQSASSTEV